MVQAFLSGYDLLLAGDPKKKAPDLSGAHAS
jgi:hypothetical protein